GTGRDPRGLMAGALDVTPDFGEQILGDRPACRDPADPVAGLLGEPEGAVGTGCDRSGRARLARDREFRYRSAGRDPADPVAGLFGEPEGAVRPGRDRVRAARPGGQ